MRVITTILQVALVIWLAGCQRDSLELSKEDYQREVNVALKHIATTLGKYSGKRAHGFAAVDDTEVDAETLAKQCKAWLQQIPSGETKAKEALLARCALALVKRASENADVLDENAYWKYISTPFAPKF